MNLKSLALNAILKIDEKSGYSILHAICINKDTYNATRIAVQAIIAGHDIKGHRVSEKAEMFAGMTTEEIFDKNWLLLSILLKDLNHDERGFLKAVTEGDVNEITRLVVQGVDVNKKIDPSHEEDEACSLMTLASMSGSQAVLNALIELGGEVNPKSLAASPLSVACAWNNYSAAKLLMRNGACRRTLFGFQSLRRRKFRDRANVNAVDSSGNTALHYAAANGNVEIVKLLMDYKARPDDVNRTENSALHLALAPDVPDVLALPPCNDYELLSANAVLRTKKAQTSHFLIKQGVEMQKENNLGQTPLYLAMCSGDTQAVLLLAEQKKESPLISDGDVQAIRRLVDMKLLDVNMKDKNKKTPLHQAAKADDIEGVSLTLKLGADINAVDKEGRTALHVAITYSRPKAALKLMEGGAKLDVKDAKGYTPLHEAASKNAEELVSGLMKHGANINSVDKEGRTALHVAITYSRPKAALKLMEGGAKLDVKDAKGYTPLHEAASKNAEELVSGLMKHGANINSVDKEGRTALHVAIICFRPKAALKLIEGGAELDVKDNNGRTVLHEAAVKGNKEIIKALLKRDADINAMDRNGCTAVDLALEKRNFDFVWFLIDNSNRAYVKENDILNLSIRKDDKEIVRKLVNKGKVNTTDKHGWTPLHVALQYRHTEIVEILLKAGAQADVQTPVGQTPLHVALEHCDVTSARLLLRYGNYKDSADKSGMTALHLAARNGYKDIVLSLVDQGSDVNAQDKSGKTPLHRAAEQGKTEMVSLLAQRGSDVTLTDKKGNTALQLAEKKPFPDTVEALRKFVSKE